MVAEYGHFALALALPLCLLQAGVLFLFPHNETAFEVGRRVAFVQFALVSGAFLTLTYLFITLDFSVLLVVEHSHSAKPLLYRIAGVWGNHEGSMLLWVLMLAGYGAALAARKQQANRVLVGSALAVQGLIGFAFLAFVLFTSNPFSRISPPPLEGLGLNPILQDPALVIHPPLLYLGYVGFSMTFALAIAALIHNRVDTLWAQYIRPWALFSWVALTVGIALGSFWAYYELGWGGFWFWDPVENASLLPWLAGTALIHSIMAVERREALKAWTVLLAIFAFAMSLLGTFLVRSGVLTSVHAFASDPDRGLFVLCIFAGFVGGGLALYAWRAPMLTEGGSFDTLSREGALVLNNLALASIIAAVLMGTLYPIILEAVSGDLVSVGPPYFNLVCGLLLVPLVATMPLGPLMAWNRADMAVAAKKLWLAALAGVGTIIGIELLRNGVSLAAAAAMGAGVWLVMGGICDLANRAGFFIRPLRQSVERLFQLPVGAYGAALAHAGLGLTLFAVACSSTFKEETLANVALGETVALGSMQLKLERIELGEGPNYAFTRGVFSIAEQGKRAHEIKSEKRRFWSRRVETTEVGLLRRGFSQIYVVLGEERTLSQSPTIQGAPETKQAWTVRAYIHPQILLIWLGALVMAAGGLLALVDRPLKRLMRKWRPATPLGAIAQPAE